MNYGKATLTEAPSRYRPDIDGLRAIAVLSVVIYHFNKAWMPGGYVGVDIFFVISGFLITRNIWSEMAAGRFSFAHFYLRRIRRIAPAFLAMVTVSLLAGAFLLLPGDLLPLAKSALWGVFSLSNVYFWRHLDTSYFAESADEVPLLHTWSLGVEEQFYFIWPSLLLVAMLFRRRHTAAIVIAIAICVASFILAELTNVAAQKFSYYMLPTRAGELMVGGLLALGTRQFSTAPTTPRAIAEAVAITGAVLVVGSLYLLDDTSRFPGINALYPCFGAAMLMMAGGMGSRMVTAMLTPRPVVFIGLISYSLYLWHWPILAFIRYFYGTLEGSHALIAAISMLVLAVASYRYVELPTRHWRTTQWKQALALYVAPSIMLGATAGLIWWSGGLEATIESSKAYRDGFARVEQYTAPAYKFDYNCQLSAHDRGILSASRCILPTEPSAPESEPTVLLWGDSQAAHYVGVLGRVAEAQGFRFRNASLSSCPPLFGGDYSTPPYKAGCDRFRPYMESAILSGRYRTVVISGAWNGYERNPSFRADLQRTVGLIAERGIKVVIIGQAPFFPGYNRECELRGLRVGGVSCRQRLAVPDSGDSNINRYLEGVAASIPNVSYLGVRNILCRNGTCDPYLEGAPAYFDATHLSMDGSWRIGTKLLSSPDRASWLAVFGRGLPAANPHFPTGFEPPFAYKIRSRKTEDSREGSVRKLVIEFKQGDAATVDKQIEGLLEAKGYRRYKSFEQGDDIVGDYGNHGHRVTVTTTPANSSGQQGLDPDSRGTVYFVWKE